MAAAVAEQRDGQGSSPQRRGSGSPFPRRGCPVGAPALSEAFRDALAAPQPAPPLTPTPCALQMAWDPEQQSQEECPVVQVQVLGET